MNKEELLYKLAIECSTWNKAISMALTIGVSKESAITEQDWLDERARLINKPKWENAPDGATHLALGKSILKWNWYFGKPWRSDYWREWGQSEGHVEGVHAGWAKNLPAGYDWKTSLESRPL